MVVSVTVALTPSVTAVIDEEVVGVVEAKATATAFVGVLLKYEEMDLAG